LLIGHCIIAETKCSWYLCNINIFSLLEKKRANVTQVLDEIEGREGEYLREGIWRGNPRSNPPIHGHFEMRI
jgi:hypothetical protein